LHCGSSALAYGANLPRRPAEETCEHRLNTNQDFQEREYRPETTFKMPRPASGLHQLDYFQSSRKKHIQEIPNEMCLWCGQACETFYCQVVVCEACLPLHTEAPSHPCRSQTRSARSWYVCATTGTGISSRLLRTMPLEKEQKASHSVMDKLDQHAKGAT